MYYIFEFVVENSDIDSLNLKRLGCKRNNSTVFIFVKISFHLFFKRPKIGKIKMHGGFGIYMNPIKMIFFIF